MLFARNALRSAQRRAPQLGRLFSGTVLATPSVGLQLLLAGALKVVYDLWIFAVFRNVKLPEEQS